VISRRGFLAGLGAAVAAVASGLRLLLPAIVGRSRVGECAIQAGRRLPHNPLAWQRGLEEIRRRRWPHRPIHPELAKDCVVEIAPGHYLSRFTPDAAGTWPRVEDVRREWYRLHVGRGHAYTRVLP